jgi:hypothetical protein
LKKVTLEHRKKNDKDSHLTDEEYLEAHPELRPVVVIDNYLHNASESSVVYDKITEWAAGLTAGNIAHVIFLTTDVSYAKPLSKALPNSVFRTITLGDCSLEVGRKFVVNHLAYESKDGKTQPRRAEELEDLDACIETLGGRVTDLEFMAHRIEAGETPRGTSRAPVTFYNRLLTYTQGAVNRIIEQSASEILKMFLLTPETIEQSWTHEQAWYLIKRLAECKDGALSYNEIVLSELFKENGEVTLRALEHAELISIAAVNGCPQTIRPGKPVLRAAFKKVTENKALSSRMDLAIISQKINKENKSIGKYEEELSLLGSLPRQPRELTDRIQWLLNKVYSSQNKIAKYEKESAYLQKLLRSEH